MTPGAPVDEAGALFLPELLHIHRDRTGWIWYNLRERAVCLSKEVPHEAEAMDSAADGGDDDDDARTRQR